MQLKTMDGKAMFVNDELSYQKYLESSIVNYQNESQKRQLSQEEVKEINEMMYLYNQIVDYLREEKEKEDEENSVVHRR